MAADWQQQQYPLAKHAEHAQTATDVGLLICLDVSLYLLKVGDYFNKEQEKKRTPEIISSFLQQRFYWSFDQPVITK